MTGMPVDDEGMFWEGLDTPSPALIFTSPSHQFPYGSVLSARRRPALLDLARQHNARIIEDDYDSEFRYSGEPVPAMLGMVNNAPVVYLGTFSKTLFPSLRMGFMVLPRRWQKRPVRPLARCCVAGIAPNSEPWRCLLRKDIMPATLPPCAGSTVSATDSCVRC